MLDNISIASPCSTSWDEMTGDNAVRFCGECRMNVYNLSGMSRQEVEELVKSHEGRLCVRFYRREDGTILTQDCPVGLKILHRRRTKIRRGGIAAAITLVTALGIFSVHALAEEYEKCPSGQNSQQPSSSLGTSSKGARLGKVVMPPGDHRGDHENEEMMGEVIIGDVMIEPPPENVQDPAPPADTSMGSPKNPEPKQAEMGRFMMNKRQ